jgi:hypothetical protein
MSRSLKKKKKERIKIGKEILANVGVTQQRAVKE